MRYFHMGYGIFHCDSMKYNLILHWITMEYAVSCMKMSCVWDCAISVLSNLPLFWFLFDLQDRAHRSLLYGGFILFSILIYVKFYLDDLESSLSTLGTVGILTCIFMFGSPLATIVSIQLVWVISTWSWYWLGPYMMFLNWSERGEWGQIIYNQLWVQEVIWPVSLSYGTVAY